MGQEDNILVAILTKPRIEREVAFVIDLFLCLTLAVFPNKIGVVIAAAYFFLRDNPLLFGGQSFGKRIFNLQVQNTKTSQKASSRATLVRSLLIVVPIFNIFDFLHFAQTGNRLTDEWFMTKVVKLNSQQQK